MLYLEKFGIKKLKKKGENDYIVIPDQPWLDGINNGDGTVKQFVAMPLGSGYTVEGQVTGKEEFGGIQMIVFDSFKEEIKYEKQDKNNFLFDKKVSKNSSIPTQKCEKSSWKDCDSVLKKKSLSSTINDKFELKEKKGGNSSSSSRILKSEKAKEMGLSSGGKMKQKIYKDTHGISFWNQNKFARIYVHIVNSTMYSQITGKKNHLQHL